jgi:hypothetical protein
MTRQLKTKAPNNTKELRSFLLEQMLSVASGNQEAGQAKAICNYAQQVYNTVNLEMKFAMLNEKMDGKDVKAVGFGG